MNPASRKEEFLEAAKVLFDEKGFESTSVEDIVERVGVAKGLFYYYFESKDALLKVLIDRLQNDMMESTVEVVQTEGLSAMERLDALFSIFNRLRVGSRSMISYFHKPQNRYLHLDLERRGLERLVPVLESIIRQGVEEGVFHTDHPRETAESYLATSSALGHRDIGDLDEEGIMSLVSAFQDISERLLGAESGTLDLYKRHLSAKLGELRADRSSEGMEGRF